jgi:hypothetical protein
MTLVPLDVLAVDATFLSTRDSATDAKGAAPYDSEYAAAAREFGDAQGTPEADARPGEYYFLLGAHAFQKRDYEFAIQMYEVAASWAYKPAEFNLGVMYARGQGIPADLSRGLAWMALASERNDQHYVDAREAIYAEMTKEQFDQANAIWRELKKTYGDEVALRRAKARWGEVRAHVTGSHVGSVGNLEVSSSSGGQGDASNPNNPAFIGIAETKERETRLKVGASNIKGFHVNSPGATTPGEATGAQGVDGSIAYGRLRESDNPYDPKFRNSAIGIATVGAPTPTTAGPAKEETEDKAQPARHDQQ